MNKLKNYGDWLGSLKRLWCHQFTQKSFSQEGEDLILKRVFANCPKGFYVDVGAFHPMLYSNTYLFYRLGWQGINIDARPGSMFIFDKIRPRDINVECAVSDENEPKAFYIFGSSGFRVGK